jgi:homoserine kinase
MSEGEVTTATFGEKLPWRLILAVPSASLSTTKARALLPATYSRMDAVANVQNTALLVSAFALDRPGILRTAMADYLHQPYRQQACPLLPLLLPMANEAGVYGVALSGAGPSVLLITDPNVPATTISQAVRCAAQDPGVEIIVTAISGGVEIS